MISLSRFNPAKSLFLRVFLWFWLAALLIFFGSVWLAKQLDSEAKYRPLTTQQFKNLTSISKAFQYQVDKRNGNVVLEKVLNRVSVRNRSGLILVDTQTRELVHNLPRHRRIQKGMFDDFDLQSSPLMLEVQGVTFVGPAEIRANQANYMLFLVKPRPGGSFRVMQYEYPEVFILFMLSFSLALCYLFVRGLLNPIAQLSHASKRMATGEMGVRVGAASRRLDEIGQLSRDFNLMSAQVETLLTSQKRLLADISHELRSPLTRLQLSIGIALQQNASEMSEKMLTALQRIEKESQQIEDMIGQVLLLSRLDNKQPIQNMQTISIEQIMAPIIDDAQFEAKQKNKKVAYQLEKNINFQADPQLLSAAIENILRNAIHYSNCIIQVKVTVLDNHIEWVIEDDGNGIENNQREKIFEAFYRDSTARDRHSGGVGLGLAIAKQAIDKHKGVIEANNKPQGGLQVNISIPIIRA